MGDFFWFLQQIIISRTQSVRSLSEGGYVKGGEKNMPDPRPSDIKRRAAEETAKKAQELLEAARRAGRVLGHCITGADGKPTHVSGQPSRSGRRTKL